MSDDVKPDEVVEPQAKADEKPVEVASENRDDSDTATPAAPEGAKSGSLAEAQAERYMNRALGRSTQTNLSKFTNNRLQALPSTSGEADSAPSEPKGPSAAEASEKIRSAERVSAPPNYGQLVPALAAVLLIAAGAGYYFLSPKKEKPAVPPVAAPVANYKDPARAALLLTKAEMNIRVADYKKALLNLKTAYKIDPDNRAIYLEKIGECLSRVQEYRGAEASSRALLEMQPNNVNGLLQHAQASYMIGNKLSARNDLFKAASLAPTNAEVFMARGSFYKAEKEYSSAEEDLKQALKLDPKTIGAKEKLLAVQTALKAGSHAKAKTAVVSHSSDSESTTFTPAETKQLQSSDLKSLRDAGLQAMSHRKYAFAQAALERCVVINPNDVQSRKLLAYALINSGNANAAFDQFNAWDSLANLGLEEQLAFGRALNKAGDDATTTAFFNFLVDDNSTNAQNLLRIAQIADRAGCTSSVQKAVDYGLKISSGTTKYQFTVLMRKVQNGQVGTDGSAGKPDTSSAEYHPG